MGEMAQGFVMSRHAMTGPTRKGVGSLEQVTRWLNEGPLQSLGRGRVSVQEPPVRVEDPLCR